MKIEKFKVEEWFNKYEKHALYDLADTCVDSLSVNELLKICNQSFDEVFSRKLNYGDIYGSERLTEGIKSLYKNQTSSNITITHGTIGANHLVFQTIIERGDKVVSVLPTYQQHYSIPLSIGAKVTPYRLREENCWLPDLEEFEKIVGHDTKLICINNPNNPTGAVIPDDMLEQIIEIAKKSNAYILCDEVYRGLNHQGNPFSASVADMYDKGISTSSMSKTFSLAGLRLGWICAGKDLIREINTHREYNTISVGILDDYLASMALENKDLIVKRNLEKLRTGKKILTDWAGANKNSVHLIEPKGGTTAFLGYNSAQKSTDLCADLQKETGVMLLPGETMEYDGYVRIGFGNNFENLKKGLNIFANFLSR